MKNGYHDFAQIRSHSARRASVQDMLARGIPSAFAMYATGHRDLSSFQKYVDEPGVAYLREMNSAVRPVHLA